MTERNCMEMLSAKFSEGKHVCVGLDTDPQKISKEIGALICKEDNLPPCGATGPLMRGFNTRIIKSTKDLVCAYKFNLKFYLAEMYQGLFALERSIAFIKEAAPDTPVILDSKDGDVGVSLIKAAEFAFDKLGVDAVTVNPWGGKADGLDAFLRYKDKGIFVWCRGSNEGSREIQDTEITHPYPGGADQPLYELVAELVSGFMEYGDSRAEYGWNKNGNCGLVVGASSSDLFAIKRARQVVGDMPILIPGVGAQRGDLEKAVKDAMYIDLEIGKTTLPAIFNSSRSIIYASSGIDFSETARKEVMRLNRQIRKMLKEECLR